VTALSDECRVVLFLCTGNYYRSRFAEEYFNAIAPLRSLRWRAVSCALDLRRGTGNVGPISHYVPQELKRYCFYPVHSERYPSPCEECDLRAADLIIALSEEEHRPLLKGKFPHWADRVSYWRIHDIELSPPAAALSGLARNIDDLIRTLE
jgi:protein-tyrosine phosphatase